MNLTNRISSGLAGLTSFLPGDPDPNYKPLNSLDNDEEDEDKDYRGPLEKSEDSELKSKSSENFDDEEELTHFRVAGAKVFISYDADDLVNEDYEKRSDLQIKVSFKHPGFVVYTDYGYGLSNGDFYKYSEIKKINHKRGPKGNFLNIILSRNNENLCFCTPESAQLKAVFLEYIKKKSNLKVADYRSNH